VVQSAELVQKGGASRTKLISISAVFAALAIILHPPFLPLGVPAPYAPFLIYQIWEIPLVVAMLLYGLRVGVLVSVINFVTLIIFFPGTIITGPFYNLLAIFSTMSGVFIGYRVLHFNRFDILWFSTLMGLATRTAIMTVVNGVALPLPPPKRRRHARQGPDPRPPRSEERMPPGSLPSRKRMQGLDS